MRYAVYVSVEYIYVETILIYCRHMVGSTTVDIFSFLVLQHDLYSILVANNL